MTQNSSHIAQTLIASIDELTVFIQARFDNKPNKKNKKSHQPNQKKSQAHKKYARIDDKIIKLHLSIIGKDKYSKESNEEKSVPNKHKYSTLINPNKKTDLYLKWENYFCLSEETENRLLLWVMKAFPFEKYGFADKKDDIKMFLQQKSNESMNIKSDVTGRPLIEFDCDLVVKTMNKFYNFRLNQWLLLQNKTLNMFFKDNAEKEWWNKQLTLNNIDANEWYQKCIKWKIMPSRLLKEIIAAKKLFICHYNLSVNFDKYQQAFLDYYDEKSDLEDDDYYKPLKHIQFDNDYIKDPIKQTLKEKKNRGFKSIKAFLSEIGKIPHSKGGYDKFMNDTDNTLKMKQYKIYNKWIRYTQNTHRRKWMRYLTKKVENDTIQQMDEYKQMSQTQNDYNIPNADKLLTVKVCEEMCKILLMDGVLGNYHKLSSHSNASEFERFVFNAIKTVFGERNDAKMMNERDVGKSGCSEVTPDVLFSSSVNVNGVDIYWMDMKHYYVTSKECITFRSLGHQIKSYVRAFGNGAIVCCGFQSNFIEKLRETYPEITSTVLMLDASEWYAFAKQQR